MTEDEERQMVVREALEWENTPYHHMGRVKKGGCDCLTFLAGVFENVHLVPKIEIPHYAQQWHMHQKAELYLEGVMKYAAEIPLERVKPGSLIVWKIGNVFSHGAIVLNYPEVIHSFIQCGVVRVNVEQARGLHLIAERGNPDCGKPRPVKYFDLWAKKNGLPI